ncbi:hypothetical protein BGZ59_000726 [Podila verticillata]|nr:hypothetical protein BGZ59_000726 [Podila verticillata]KFH69243.1 hypothetical protein MVEG_04058 [Podila verticillata NRRL 6337]
MASMGQRRLGVATWAVTLLAIFTTFMTSGVFALDEAQAGIADWHHKWIGTPNLAASPRSVRGATNVFVATDKNTVASIKSKTGELLWRQVLRKDEPVLAIRAVSGHLLALTGTDEFHARLFDGKSGQVLWDFAPQGENALPGAPFGQDVTTTFEDSNLIILNQGANVRKIHAKAGTEAWHWKAEEGSPTAYFGVLESKGFSGHDNVVYVAGVTRGIDAFTIEVVALDSTTGQYLKTFTAHSKLASVGDAVVLGGGSNDKPGYLAWLEKDALKVLTLGTDKVADVSLKTIIQENASLEELVSTLEIVNLRLPEGHSKFLLTGTIGEYHDGKGTVLVDVEEKTGKPIVLKDLGDRSGFSAYSATIKPNTNEVVVLRTYREDPDNGMLELHDSSDIHAAPVQFAIPLDYNKFAHFSFASLELFTKGQGIQTRIYFATMDGSFHSFTETESERWYREESMAYIKEVEFVDLPERKLWTQDKDETGHQTAQNVSLVERYIQRLTTHVAQLKDLPAFVLSYANPSSLFTKAPTAVNYNEVSIGANNTIQPLYRDQFGLRKILIFGTSKGKLIAVDSANQGQIIWSRFFPWGHDIKNLVLVRHANVRLPPVLAMIAETIDGGQNKMIRTYRLNALTGADYETESFYFPAAAWIPAGYLSIFKLPIEDPDEKTQVLAIVDERMHITPFPSTEAVQIAFKEISKDVYFMLKNKIGAKELNGYKAIISSDMERMDVEPTWNIPFPEGEEIVAFGERPSYEVLASLGRVLGDRGVLYKYQNANYVTVITASAGRAGSLPYMTVYLIDVVKGSILYQATHENIGWNQPILATQYENNVVYTFWSEGDSATSAKGYQAVSLELYESKEENQRVKSDTFSSFTSERPHVISQAFPFPYEATAIGVTSTKAGISGKDILFGLSRQTVMSVNKRFLDPRRPMGAPSAAEKEEMLIPYGGISEDPRQFLSYHLEVAGIKKIVTAPTLLESTTVVVAFGQDVFVTRHAPSKTFDILNEDFSKSQLLLTIVTLVVLLFVTAPMMKNKMLKELWY